MPTQPNNFQELEIFDNNEVNVLCDNISAIVNNITGNQMIICGSVAKMLDFRLQTSYIPKDVDFTVNDWDFRKLIHELPKKIEGVKMIEKQPSRIILYTSLINIEIFSPNSFYKFEIKHYKNLIPYTSYAN